jgi:hypothetical protein
MLELPKLSAVSVAVVVGSRADRVGRAVRQLGRLPRVVLLVADRDLVHHHAAAGDLTGHYYGLVTATR